MLTLRLDPEMEQQLTHLAQTTHRTKSHYAKLALKIFLEERAAHLLALARWENVESGSGKLVSLEEVEREMGIVHEH